MSFEEHESSAVAGHRVHLYTWVRGANSYRFAAADSDLVIDFQTYAGSGAIEHEDIEQTTDPIRSGIEVTVDEDHPVAQLYQVTPPMDSVILLIQACYIGDESNREPVWQGRITGVKWEPERGRAVITHEPTYTSLRRTGLRRNYQRLCPLVWGGKRCGLNPEAFVLSAPVQEISGLDLVIPAAASRPDGYFMGGFIAYEITSGVFERRPIRDHEGAAVRLSAFPVGLRPGVAVKMYPGDDHTADTCADKFNNIDNYGGFIYFPKKNPFGGTPVY